MYMDNTVIIFSITEKLTLALVNTYYDAEEAHRCKSKDRVEGNLINSKI